jgi:polar amino acid transport system substrate-binding protein
MQLQIISRIIERRLWTARVTPQLTGLAIGVLLAAVLALGGPAYAQNPAKPGAEAAPQAVPGFWDPRRRPDRPDLSRLSVIRFLTETDYPPFNFTGPDGNPAGFNVDLARQLCEEIKVTCTIQMRRFETLLDAIASNRGDAIIASLAVTPQMRARLDFTDPYYRAAARCCDDRGPPGISGRQEGRRRRRLLARGLSQGDVHRRRTAFLSQ